MVSGRLWCDLFIYRSLRGAHQAVANQQPELEQWCFTYENTTVITKRTHSDHVLYSLIRTNVQNAFGKITNMFARILLISCSVNTGHNCVNISIIFLANIHIHQQDVNQADCCLSTDSVCTCKSTAIQ